MKNQKFAIIFPGQGSQTLGMLADVADKYPIVTETFALASDKLGYDIWSICQKDEKKLDQTEYTQPALLTASVALWKIIQTKTIQIDFLAGHSLGEYSALVCAGVIEFADAVEIVSLRGKFMQSAVGPGVGSMAAILGLDDALVIDICKQASSIDSVVTAANFNSPGQVVIAGHSAAVEKAMQLATANGSRRAIMLPVSVPSHCQLMQPAADKLLKVLQTTEIQSPKIKVIHNVDVTCKTQTDDIVDALKQQLYKPVRWTETILSMSEHGVTSVIECGAGKVLTGLNKRIDRSMDCNSIGNLTDLEKFLQQ